MLSFQCNICGNICTAELESLRRETRSCAHCNSTPRTRAVVRALSIGLFEQNLILPQFPIRKELTGLGLTDAESYASQLKERFTYLNTYFHREPRLDIMSDEIEPSRSEANDFIISSEVFEHVLPPVQKAFQHVYKMLKPGGLLVLTVPYGLQSETTEYFPELHQFTLVEKDGVRTLTNITRSGVSQTFRELVFHGGPGATLEMRLFSYSGVLDALIAAGFDQVIVHDTPDFDHGIWWPAPCSFPFTARKSVAIPGTNMGRT